MYTDFKGKRLATSDAAPKVPATEGAAQAAKLFIDSLRKKEGPEKAFRHLGKTSKEDVMKWTDDKGLDLMHHTIILNNPEAVEYLLQRGYFQAPLEPETNSYPHLACLLGNRTALNIILRYRPDDNRPSTKLTYDPTGNGLTDDSRTRRREVSPIDVAAEAGHLHCVKQILDQCVIKKYPDYAKYPYVALACVTGSTLALTLVTKKDKPKTDDLHKAVELALKSAMPQCLDILLKENGVKPGAVFDKMNFFHVLYSLTNVTAFGEGSYRRLPDVTQVLVKHKHNVNSKNPPNTYPLYSLIRNSFCIHDYINTRHYMMCLRILLEAGADPNFDEVEHEKTQNKRGVKTIHGRQAYSSAMHCLIETIEYFAEYLDSKALGCKFVTAMADILFQHHAKINMVGRLGDGNCKLYGSVLHHYAKSSVKLGIDVDIFKFLLRQGADPNSRVDGKYVINTFFDNLFERLAEETPWNKEAEMLEESEKTLGLSVYMSRDAVRDTYRIFKNDHSTRHTSKHIRPLVSFILQELERRVKEVWPLKRLCRCLIWDLCSRNATVVHKLPTDIESRTYILPIL